MRKVIVISLPALMASLAQPVVATGGTHSFETKKLEDLVELKEVDVSKEFANAANEIYFYKEYLENPVDRYRYEGKIDKEEYFKLNLRFDHLGYKSPFLPDYTFVRILGGGGGLHELGVCAVYEPKFKEVEAPEHKLFPGLDCRLILYEGDIITWNIADLFWRHPETITTDRIADIAYTAVYIYYWCLLKGGYKYGFGDKFEGIYVFDYPPAIFQEPVYSAVASREELPKENKTMHISGLFPEGRLDVFFAGSGFDYYFYTWDMLSRELFLWYFISSGEYGFSIKYVVIGKL
jgi:hypothetical protein